MKKLKKFARIWAFIAIGIALLFVLVDGVILAIIWIANNGGPIGFFLFVVFMLSLVIAADYYKRSTDDDGQASEFDEFKAEISEFDREQLEALAIVYPGTFSVKGQLIRDALDNLDKQNAHA